MREYNITIPLNKGIRPQRHTPRNKGFLYTFMGGFVEDAVAQSLDDVIHQVAFTATYPFPQIFRTTDFTLICTDKNIYEFDHETRVVTLAYSGPNAGWTWSLADFGIYILMTNGAVTIYRDPTEGIFKRYVDCEIPPSLCMCEFKGQIIIGGPGESVPAGFTGA